MTDRAFSKMLAPGSILVETPNIPGVFLLKLPSSRTRQAANAIEINPVDFAGQLLKRRYSKVCA